MNCKIAFGLKALLTGVPRGGRGVERRGPEATRDSTPVSRAVKAPARRTLGPTLGTGVQTKVRRRVAAGAHGPGLMGRPRSVEEAEEGGTGRAVSCQ